MTSPWGKPIQTVKPRPWRVGNKTLGGDRPLLMGILNVTPDSFFDGNQYQQLDKAIAHAEKLIAEGADILDIGGESSRPGAQPVSTQDEIARTIPLIAALSKRFTIPLSIDTVKSEVARTALDAGAMIINDISAMTFDPMMLELPQAYQAGVVLNHMRGQPQNMQKDPEYKDVTREVHAFLQKQIQTLAALGLSKEFIAVDPGIGFGKTPQHNYRLIEELESFDTLGCPILLGASRKSFVGKTLGLENSNRLIPSIATALYAALKGAAILRVHDVAETREAMLMLAAIRQ